MTPFLMGTTSSITVQSLGEDRTMRAGCRCENVVFVFCLSRSESGAPCFRGVHSSNKRCMYFAPPLTGFPLEFGIGDGTKNGIIGLLDGRKKFQDGFSRLDTIPAYDRQTDRQPSFDGKDRAYA